MCAGYCVSRCRVLQGSLVNAGWRCACAQRHPAPVGASSWAPRSGPPVPAESPTGGAAADRRQRAADTDVGLQRGLVPADGCPASCSSAAGRRKQAMYMRVERSPAGSTVRRRPSAELPGGASFVCMAQLTGCHVNTCVGSTAESILLHQILPCRHANEKYPPQERHAE